MSVAIDNTNNLRKGLAEAATDRRECVSIVVITYNRADTLLTCLQSIAQVDTRGEFVAELVVVDNASTDNTAEVVAEFAADCSSPVRWVCEEQAGVAFARNRGVREARGDWICFFDDDQTAEPDWVWQLWSVAKREKVCCVGGARDLLIEDDLPAPRAEVCRRLLGEWPTSIPPSDYHLRWLPNTGNVLVHKSVFEEIGGFDERAYVGGEDTEFFDRLLRSGRRARFTPDSLLHHHIPANRLSPEYLQWVALRHGIVMGRRDSSGGRLMLATSLVMRLGQAAVVLLPQWATLRIFGQKDLALGPLCRLRRAEGFARFALHELAPQLFGSKGNFAAMHHRNSAVVASQEESERDSSESHVAPPDAKRAAS